jgi:predicted MFS family arabinose efflux permease
MGWLRTSGVTTAWPAAHPAARISARPSPAPRPPGLAAQLTGLRYMATLLGIVFFRHQIGSFLGVWLGGYLYDVRGSYDVIWWMSIALGLIAALLHWPIDERAVVRLQTQR